MSEMIERVDRAMRNVVYQTGGKHGLTWQIVQQFTGPDSSDVIMYVGPPFKEEDSLRSPNADIAYEMRRCKARAAIEAMRTPTEEMSFAALGMDTAPEQAVEVWQAMIDAALVDIKQTPSTE